MRAALFAMLAAMGTLPSGDPVPPYPGDLYPSRRRGRRSPTPAGPPPKPKPDLVQCPTCGAAPGEPCNPRTLGRWPFHKSRVRAAMETR